MRPNWSHAAGASETLTVVPTHYGLHFIAIKPAPWAAAVSSSPPAAHPPAARRALGRRPCLLMLIATSPSPPYLTLAGKIVLQKLRERPEFAEVKGLVRCATQACACWEAGGVILEG